MRILTALTGLVAGLSVLAAATPARAFEVGTPEQQQPYRSAQNFAFELRFGPYKPQIDDEPALAGRKPYEQAFGTMPRLLVAMELDWQTFRIPHLGTIGPGLGVGNTSMSTKVTTVSGRPSGDETSLDVIPVWGVGVLRADVLWRELGVPFVPYAKLGVAVARWKATNSGDTSVASGVSGKGTTWGANAALGLQFSLDALDSGAARNMDNMLGINGTYLFAEYYWLGLNGIGQSAPLRVGTTSWTAGLVFEM
jgi:hypothetical protein